MVRSLHPALVLTKLGAFLYGVKKNRYKRREGLYAGVRYGKSGVSTDKRPEKAVIGLPLRKCI